MLKELAPLMIVAALVGFFVSFSVLSGPAILGITVLVFLGPIGWGIVTNYITHPGHMGFFLYYLAFSTGGIVGMVAGHIVKVW
jgi:hypothetical protein